MESSCTRAESKAAWATLSSSRISCAQAAYSEVRGCGFCVEGGRTYFIHHTLPVRVPSRPWAASAASQLPWFRDCSEPGQGIRTGTQG